MSVFPTITLCMIVKDEAHCIQTCLESVKELVDEMIIVDTGSTDATISLCEASGAKVFAYEWKNDFAAARNYGLSFASGDWILWLDADEEMDAEGIDKLPTLLANTTADFLSLPVMNYYGESFDRQHAYLLYQPRLFRHHQQIRFQQPIHETPHLPGDVSEDRLANIPVVIHHYGYLDEFVKVKQKGQRNIQILEESVATADHSPWMEYHLASEYYRLKNYEQAFQYVNQSIVLFLQQKQLPPSFLYKLKYAILIETNSLEGAWPSIEKAILLYPDYVDLYFYKGYILYELKRFSEALQAFHKCLELGDHHTKYLILQGVGSFKAWHYKGLCLERLGKMAEAQEAFQYEKQAREEANKK
ncbi:glycosyltransferase [Bacillus tuaregi]|uniref:glycosyltransferase n=1 Tax=Bacillus tuaregi TaxID=1816695 RepID=UPI0008F83503|nr:glycosyltransferase family 2 protein [Bacillus tuaregi]